ncbi:MAG: CHAT domain-containing protein [Hassallia sp.]
MNIETPAKKILILAANPKQTSRLRLDEEVRDIKEGLRLSQQRDKFILQQEWAVRPRDVRRAVLDFRPNIIHFSGHGAGSTGLSFEDETGKEKLVTGEALAGLFGQFAKQVECVVLNACYSEEQALAIAQHIDYVIGMNAAIGDKAALEFAVGFYDALVAYDPRYDTYSRIEFAFNIACNAIQFAGVSGISIPIMKKKPHLGKVEEQPANLVEESRSSNDTVPVRQNLSQEDVVPIEAIISNKQSTSTNQNEPNSLDESRLSSNTATLSQNHKQSFAETSAPANIRLPNRLSNSISVLRNKKSLIGAGIAAALALTSYFLVTLQPDLGKSVPPTDGSTVVSTENADAFYRSGKDKLNKKDYKGAIEDYNKAESLDSNPNKVNKFIFYNRGKALFQVGRYEEAIRDFTTFIEKADDEAKDSGYDKRGDTFHKMGKNQEARDDYERSAELYRKQGLQDSYKKVLNKLQKLPQ